MNKFRNKSLYLFLLPMILVLILMVLYPFVANLCYSFMDYKLIQPDRPFVFLDNYIKIFKSEDFTGLLSKTLIWSAGNIIFILLLGVSTAMLLDSDIKGKLLLQTVLLIPWVIPEVVTGYTWKWMMASDYGILNRILLDLGIIGPDFSWFRDGKMAMVAVIMANVWRSFPFVAVMVYAKKRSMPKDWVEAALIDGANSGQIFWYITLPYLKTVIISVITLVFIWAFSAFGIIYAMTDGGPLGATTIFPIYIHKKGMANFDFGITAAMSVLMMICLVTIYGAKYVPAGIRKLFHMDKEV